MKDLENAIIGEVKPINTDMGSNLGLCYHVDYGLTHAKAKELALEATLKILNNTNLTPDQFMEMNERIYKWLMKPQKSPKTKVTHGTTI